MNPNYRPFIIYDRFDACNAVAKVRKMVVFLLFLPT